MGNAELESVPETVQWAQVVDQTAPASDDPAELVTGAHHELAQQAIAALLDPNSIGPLCACSPHVYWFDPETER